MREIKEPKLRDLTTIHLGGKALALLKPENEDDLLSLKDRAKALGGDLFFIGRGSNLLAKDSPLALCLVSMAAFDQIRIIKKDERRAIIEAGAGVPLPRLLRFCLSNGLSGLAGLMGIPGNVGGACAMNAGSFGSEIGSLIEKIEAFNGESHEVFPAEKIKLGYRALKLAETGVTPLITRVFFALTPCRKSVILRDMNLNYLEKKSRQPLGAWSAGCAFKNPPDGPPAWRLIKDAGLAGKKIGGMTFSLKHANFLINEGKGEASAALELIGLAQEKALELGGVRLETEIRIIS